MKLLLLLLCCFAAFPMLGLAQTASVHSSDSVSSGEVMPVVPTARQADAIVLAKEAQKQVERDERESRRVRFVVKDSQEYDSGEQKVIFNRVAPPSRAELEHAASKPEKEQVPPTAEELAKEERLLNLEQAFFYYSATVFDFSVTHLRWDFDGQTYTAWSNVDFNYLRGVNELELEGTYYHILIGIGNEMTPAKARESLPEQFRGGIPENTPSPIPNGLEFTSKRPEYVVFLEEGQSEPAPEAFAVIDALHNFYAENARKLHAERQRNEALAAAKARYETANPEPKKDVIINFWPKKNSDYLEKSQ